MFIRFYSIKFKRALVKSYDGLVALISFPLALVIRFNTFDLQKIDVVHLREFVTTLFVVKLVIFSLMKLSRGVWRFASTRDLLLIFKASTLATLVSTLILFVWFRGGDLPRSAIFLDLFITVFLLGAGRFFYRIFKERSGLIHKEGDKTLIIGAGNAGVQLLRDIHQDKNSSFVVIGFIDDDKDLLGRTIHGVQTIGGTSDILSIVKDTEATHAFIAIPSAEQREIKRVAKICLDANLKVRTLPALKEIRDGKIELAHLRPIHLEDLLGREAVVLDTDHLHAMIKNKNILVTGAGGSIGRELCHQILKFKPQHIYLFEQCEYFIYQAEMELQEAFPQAKIISIVGDIRDITKLRSVFKKYSPHMVFHAAAYKHVPLMEANPREAIKNNVLGTKNVALISHQFHVETFVMISTDKAVNPTNIMGASKRIAEIAIEGISHDSQTKFMIVRFGNVLGSAGSVIPHFVEQIKKGGPVTVTHPDIIRYFMTIPEATQLVLQAASMGKGGELFVLEMGGPVKILRLAEDLIKLSGHIPYEDIDIEFSGLRPGEKLFEELLTDEESTLPTSHNLVRVAQSRRADSETLDKINKMLEHIETIEDFRPFIQDIVPEFYFV